MTELLLGPHRIDTVFDLLGHNENDITSSLGWVLSRSEPLLDRFIKDVFDSANCGSAIEVRLQTHDPTDGGFTDLEIDCESGSIILEAKRGWTLPQRPQLEKYAPRFSQLVGSRHTAIVVVSDCSSNFAAANLPPDVMGIPVVYRSWRQLSNLCGAIAPSARPSQRRLLREFQVYLRRVMDLQEQSSNIVFVVSVARSAEWSSISPVDYIEKQGIYFHPYAIGSWPKNPPNYLGFRYDGKLQSIHHVDGCEVVPYLHARVPEVWEKEKQPHVLYKLGPAIRPDHTVRTGKLYRGQRVRVAIDLLLTSETISDARDKTQQRQPIDI